MIRRGRPFPPPRPTAAHPAASRLAVRGRGQLFHASIGCQAVAPSASNASTTSGSNCVPAPRADLLGRGLDGPRLLVRALVHEHVEHVGDVHEPRLDAGSPRRPARRGSRCRPSARGVARDRSAVASRSESPPASTRAPSTACVLTTSNSSSVSLPGLEQDRVRDRDLADVVQRRRAADQPDRRGRRCPRSRASRAARSPTRCVCSYVLSSRYSAAMREPLQRVERAPPRPRAGARRAWSATTASSSTGARAQRARARRARAAAARRAASKRPSGPVSSSSAITGGPRRARADRAGRAARAGVGADRQRPRPAGRARPARRPRRGRPAAPSASAPVAATRLALGLIVAAGRRRPRAASCPASGVHTGAHHGGRDRRPAHRHGHRRLPDRVADRPRRHGRRLPRAPPQPRSAGPR